MHTKTILTAITALVMTASAVKAGETTKYTADPAKSTMKWKGEKVTGEHTGSVKLKSGSVDMKDGKLVSGMFVMDMTTIANNDLEDQEYRTKLVNHLKSDDFFGVEKHPTAKMMIKQAIPKGENKYDIVADLTIKGITKEVKFPATVTTSDKEVKGEAEIVIDRTKYDIKYGSGSFFDDLGDKAIYDEFTLYVTLIGKS